MVNDLRQHRPANALALPRLMNGDLDDKQRVIQRFGQQEAGELSVGHGQQLWSSSTDRRCCRRSIVGFPPARRARNLAKRLGRRALNCGQRGISLSWSGEKSLRRL
jgi:hypothetical protein